ncbi:MAG TPA: Fe(3+) ABC transporter substrate-binding protein [Pantoea sp.]|nr:Fe(3+) ABC transporter substrate-binding protein [Pantoea sp.]
MRTSFNVLMLAGLLVSAVSHADDAPAGKLVVYTSQAPEIAQQTMDAFRAAYPNVQVEWTRNGTTQLMNVLRTEMMSGQAKPDVLLIADAINLGALKNENQLYRYSDAPLRHINPAFYDKDKTFFGTKIIATVIAYNTQHAQPIDSWNALAVEANKGQIAVPSPLYSGAALYKLHTDINTPSIGWNFYKQLAAIGVAPQGGNGPALKAVASGLDKYGIITDADVILAKKKGSPVDLVYPKEGVSYVTEPVAIMKSVHNLPAAKAFVNFMLSEPGQKLVVEQGNRPVDDRVAAPAGFTPIDQIKLLSPDVAKAIKEDAAVRDQFTALFGG